MLPANPDHVVYTNHWSPVKIYYAVYLAVRALLEAAGTSPKPSHTPTLRAINNLITQRPFLFGVPWRVLCRGGYSHNDAEFCFLPEGVEVSKISSLTNSRQVPFWDSYAMLLRTTRKRLFDQAAELYKRQNQVSRLSSLGRAVCLRSLGDTSVFDALYRLRIRSHYLDADSFLIAEVHLREAEEWRDAAQRLLHAVLLNLELLVCRYIGHGRYGEVVDRMCSFDRHGLSEGLAGARFDLIKGRWP